jgi:nitrite reductase/ring-hydroxylating ferredoxin subunit
MTHEEEPDTGMKRREFILVSLAAAAAAGCQGVGGGAATGAMKTIDAGPAASYAADGVYSNFRSLGFFIIRRGGKLEALSSICTHRSCVLTPEDDQSFYCHCHGSEFDPNGKVTDGPATRDLPVLSTSIDASGRLVVTVPG